MQWQSGLSWAKRTDSGRVGYKYGQICRECGINERDGKTIYVRPFELVSRPVRDGFGSVDPLFIAWSY